MRNMKVIAIFYIKYEGDFLWDVVTATTFKLVQEN